MALMILTSATGSPGVTTTALGLTLTWSNDVLLADCDREPAQSIQAGYLRGADHGGRGLSALALLHREHQPLISNLQLQSIELAEHELQRRYLPGFGHPGAVRLFDPVWPELGTALAELSNRGMDVIVDAGRISPTGLPLPLLTAAECVVVLTRTSLRALASARLYLPILTEQLAGLPVDMPLGLMLVGEGKPYSQAEITNQFGISCWASIPWHERHAAVLSDGADEPRRFADTTLMHHFRAIGLRLLERLHREQDLRRDLIGGPVHV